MTYSNNPHLRRYLMEGGLAHLAVYASFEFADDRFAEQLHQVQKQHPYLDQDEAASRAAYRMLAAQDKRHKKAAQIRKRLGIRFWIIVAAIVLAGLACAVALRAAPQNRPGRAYREPTPQQMNVIRNAMRGVSLLAPMGSGLAAPQQSPGIIVQFRNSGSTLATRPAGLVILDCTTNMTCSFSGNTFTLTSSATGATAWSAITAGTNTGQALLVGTGSSFGPTGSGTITSTAFTPAGTLDNCVKWGSGGALADFGAACGGGGAPAFTSITTGTNTTATMTVGTGGTLTFSGTGVLNADRINGVEFTNSEGLGQIPIGQGDGTAVWADPLVQGLTAHDAPGATTNPVAIGGFASAAVPADVSADTDIVRAWFLRNGSQVMNLASGGTLITLGQKAMTASLPVVLPSDQTVPVSGTFWQATQPVSGTVTANQGGAPWSQNLTQWNSTAIANPFDLDTGAGTQNIVGFSWRKAASGGSAEFGTATDPVRTDPTGTTTQPVSGTFWQATQPVSAASLPLPTGASVLSEQQTQTTALQLIDNIVSGSGANISQINGVAPLMGSGNTGTGSPRITTATDNPAIALWGHGATGSAPPANAVQIAGVASGSTGALRAPLNCDGYAFYDASTNGATQLVALTTNEIIYICGYSFSTSSSSAVTVKWVDGTGSNCVTAQTSLTPGVVLQAATSTGPIGKVIPVSGWSRGLKTAASEALCLLTNAAVAVQAEVWYSKGNF